jgi:hypothetical protein
MQIRERRDAVQFMQANNRDDYDIDVRQFTDGRSPEGVPYPFVRVGDSN